MKKYASFISAIVLVAMASLSCAQIKKEANLSAAAGPELRWTYEAGG